jgi:hypothetical protein
MSAEIDFGYISDDLGNGVVNANGEFTSVWTEGTEAEGTGELMPRLSVRLEELREFAPEEVEALTEQGWEQLGFRVEVTSYSADAVEDFADNYQGDDTEATTDEIRAGLATEAREILDDDAGAAAHLALSRALRVPTADHAVLSESLTARGYELPLGLTQYHGPFLTAALNETPDGDMGTLHIETYHGGCRTLLEDPEQAVKNPNADADFLPVETWLTMTSLRNKLHDAAVTYMGEQLLAETAAAATTD